ncbi:hypothetical protein Bpfe_000637, partial [Biomphalaria pfeifferi]
MSYDGKRELNKDAISRAEKGVVGVNPFNDAKLKLGECPYNENRTENCESLGGGGFRPKGNIEYKEYI